MNKFPYYKNQVLPDRLNKPTQMSFDTKEQLLEYLKTANRNNTTVYAYCNSVDSNTGLVELSFDDKHDLDVKGFIERNDVTYVHDENGEVHIGRSIDCLDNYIGVKVKDISYNKKDDNYYIKCSRKEVVKNIYDIYNDDIKKGFLDENMLVKGIITGMDEEKVFINLGGDVTGLLGIADICKSYVRHPSDILSVGQVLDLVVKKVYTDPVRISLSREILLPGWDSIDKKYKPGKIVPGIIKNRITTGIFVELDESFEGLAEFPANNKTYKYGDRVKVRIDVIDKKREKIKLRIINNY